MSERERERERESMPGLAAEGGGKASESLGIEAERPTRKVEYNNSCADASQPNSRRVLPVCIILYIPHTSLYIDVYIHMYTWR